MDDHQMFRQGLRQLLALDQGVTVVGEASTAEEALAFLVGAHDVDVVLMDINLGSKDGLWATRELRCRWPALPVLTLTVHEDKRMLLKAMEAGANGYIVKTASQEELLTAIQTVKDGSVYVYSKVAAGLLEQLRTVEPQAAHDCPVLLSPREQEVLECLAGGLGNPEIAERLHVSISTIKSQIRALFNKLGVNDRTNLLLEAFRRGLLKRPG
ncbi:MAG: response regulator transcription factor [Candidatus Eremiobacteraeota bacterium]|nr:response regulator transcription factor [Candidatus Eremiobacteraeota bacterium]